MTSLLVLTAIAPDEPGVVDTLGRLPGQEPLIRRAPSGTRKKGSYSRESKSGGATKDDFPSLIPASLLLTKSGYSSRSRNSSWVGHRRK